MRQAHRRTDQRAADQPGEQRPARHDQASPGSQREAQQAGGEHQAGRRGLGHTRPTDRDPQADRRPESGQQDRDPGSREVRSPQAYWPVAGSEETWTSAPPREVLIACQG